MSNQYYQMWRDGRFVWFFGFFTGLGVWPFSLLVARWF